MTQQRKLIIGGSLVVVALVLAALLRFLTDRYRFIINQSNLQSTQGFSVFQPVTFTFNKTLTPEFTNTCTFTTDPVATFSASFQDTVLSFTPQDMYQEETHYKASLQCTQVSFTGGFDSLSLANSTQGDMQRAQTELDFGVGQSFEEISKAQPWRDKLPLTGQYYTLVYSQVENVYIVDLSLPIGSKVTKADVETQMNAALQKIGAPTLTFKYVN